METGRRISIDLNKNTIARHERSNSLPAKAPRRKLVKTKRTKSDTEYVNIMKRDEYCVELECDEESEKKEAIEPSKVEDIQMLQSKKKEKRKSFFSRFKRFFKTLKA